MVICIFSLLMFLFECEINQWGEIFNGANHIYEDNQKVLQLEFSISHRLANFLLAPLLMLQHSRHNVFTIC